jgi:DNA gyrase subunit A
MQNDIPIDLVDEVKNSYLEYGLATLTRALPDLRDGLIPSRRRLLQTMLEEGLLPNKPYVKCARTTGLTSAYYHPHGSAYGSLISMATPWNNMIPWVGVHGNVGSTVDPPAAERYLENRLTTSALEILLQDKETWETRSNYDNSRKEAIVLNSKIPTILLNGTEGISVGYSTKIASHNLRDICDALVEGSDLYPDFPTGCLIVRDEGLQEYVKTGSGTLRLRAKLETGTQEKSGRSKERATLSYTNLPPNTNPEKIGQQVKDGLEKGKFDGISEVIDLSCSTGDCIQVVAKPGVHASTLTKYLYAYTDLESTYSARNLCIDGNKPVELSSRDLITKWQSWRLDCLGRKFAAELDFSEQRLEIVRGYLKAIDKIDAVIKVIRAASSPKEALIELVSNRTLKFTSAQARAILEMKLRALTNLDSEELQTEEGSLCSRIDELKDLISNEKVRKTYMTKEIKAIGVRYGEKRRSEVIDPPEGLTVEKGTTRVSAPAKPRFVKIDMQKGLVTQAKGPRGALILEKTDKLVILTLDGTLKKLPASYKGPISDTYLPVTLAKKENDIKERKYLAVFTLGDQLKAMMVAGEDLCKVTSKGKRVIPEEATLLYFGEGSYVVPWASTRKKKVELFPISTKQGKPGGKGIKVASVIDLTPQG